MDIISSTSPISLTSSTSQISSTSSTSQISSTDLKSKQENKKNIYFAPGFNNLDPQFLSYQPNQSTSQYMSEFREQVPNYGYVKNNTAADWFYLLSGRQEQLDEIEHNVINRMFSDSNIGYNEFKSILNKLASERCNSVCNDFIEFIISCSSELDYLLSYDDPIKNVMYNSVFGVIFCLFSNVNNLHYKEYNSERNLIKKKISSTILQPELVCLFTCCGPVFPSHKCYEDAKCEVCSKTFELKDPGKFNLENFKHIENQAIYGGNVSESKFNDLQNNQTKPILLLKLRELGKEFKNLYMVPPENYEVTKRENNPNGTFKTNIIIKNIEDSHRQDQIDDLITEISGIKNAIDKNRLKTDGNTIVDNVDKILYNLKRVVLERLQKDYDNINDIDKKYLINLRINDIDEYHLDTPNLLLGIIRCMKNSTEYSTIRTIDSKYYIKSFNVSTSKNSFRSNFKGKTSYRNHRNIKK